MEIQQILFLQFQYRISFFIKDNKKATTLRQVTGGNTPNFVFKISRQNLLFLLKTLKSNQFSASDWWGKTKSGFEENSRTFSKISITQENIKILKLKEACKTYHKMKLQIRIKAMIENLKHKLDQLENKQTKGVKLHSKIREELEGKNCSQGIF